MGPQAAPNPKKGWHRRPFLLAVHEQDCQSAPAVDGRTQSFTRRSRRALPITDTELRLIAALAIIGESKSPKNG